MRLLGLLALIMAAEAAAPRVSVVLVGDPSAAGWMPVLADCLEENSSGRYSVVSQFGVAAGPVGTGILVVAGPVDFAGWTTSTGLPSIWVGEPPTPPPGVQAVRSSPSPGATAAENQAELGARVCAAVLQVPIAHD